MFLYSLYVFINLSCSCTLSEHAIKSQVHMIQCSEIHTYTFPQSFPQVFPQDTMIHSQVTNVTQHNDTAACIKCYMHTMRYNMIQS